MVFSDPLYFTVDKLVSEWESLSESESDTPNVSCSLRTHANTVSSVTSLSGLSVGEWYCRMSWISTVYLI